MQVEKSHDQQPRRVATELTFDSANFARPLYLGEHFSYSRLRDLSERFAGLLPTWAWPGTIGS
jgi:hypothetical protein